LARSIIENFAQFFATPNACRFTNLAQGVQAAGTISRARDWIPVRATNPGLQVRKLIAFDDDTFDKLTRLGRDRMATIQELADEAFADVLKKHGIPVDLKDALRRSAAGAKSKAAGVKSKSGGVRKTRS
jgi:hypothetical protein